MAPYRSYGFYLSRSDGHWALVQAGRPGPSFDTLTCVPAEGPCDQGPRAITDQHSVAAGAGVGQTDAELAQPLLDLAAAAVERGKAPLQQDQGR